MTMALDHGRDRTGRQSAFRMTCAFFSSATSSASRAATWWRRNCRACADAPEARFRRSPMARMPPAASASRAPSPRNSSPRASTCITTGNHWADQKEILTYHRRRRPHPAPAAIIPRARRARAPISIRRAAARSVLVINAMGRVFMDAAGRSLRRGGAPSSPPARWAKAPTRSSSTCMPKRHREKMAMGHFCDGRASLVVGTHSHVPTADAQILPGGTAYQTDAGACADYDSVIGMDKFEPLQRFTRRCRGALHARHGPGHACAACSWRRMRRAWPRASSRCAWAGG